MNPLTQMAILYFIMTYVFKSNVENIALWLISGLNCWIVIQNALLRSCQSLVSRRALMQNNNIPHYLLIMADILSEFIILVPFYIVALFMLVVNSSNYINVLYVPVLLGALLIFLFGIGLVLATLTPMLRDLPYLMGIFMQIAFWLTPIAYAKSTMLGFAAVIIKMNPFTYFIQLSQGIFMGLNITVGMLVIPILISIIALGIGMYVSHAFGKKLVINL